MATNRQIIKAIYDAMANKKMEYFSFNIKDEKTPCITNYNNNFKYKIDTVYIPNIGREKYFIELDIYNSYDNQYYNIILDENDWDTSILYDIQSKIVNNKMNKEKVYKVACAILLIAQFGYMSYLMTKLFIFLFPGQSWQAVIGFIVLADLIISNAMLIFAKDK